MAINSLTRSITRASRSEVHEQIRPLCLRNVYLHIDVYHNIHATLAYLNLPYHALPHPGFSCDFLLVGHLKYSLWNVRWLVECAVACGMCGM